MAAGRVRWLPGADPGADAEEAAPIANWLLISLFRISRLAMGRFSHIVLC